MIILLTIIAILLGFLVFPDLMIGLIRLSLLLGLVIIVGGAIFWLVTAA